MKYVLDVSIAPDVASQELITSLYSLSDLAINKSFLESLMVIYKEKSTSSFDDYDYTDLRTELIDDLSENNGEKFWDICNFYVGDKDEIN